MEDDPVAARSLYDPDPTPDEDLWFLPDAGHAPDAAPLKPADPADTPWINAPQEASLDPETWRSAEARSYRALTATAEAVARFGERLRGFPEPVGDRFAIASVSSVLRGEGLWLSPEQIALYQAFRTGADDSARKKDGGRKECCRRCDARPDEVQPHEDESDDCRGKDLKESFYPQVNHPPSPVFDHRQVCVLSPGKSRTVEQSDGPGSDCQQRDQLLGFARFS